MTIKVDKELRERGGEIQQADNVLIKAGIDTYELWDDGLGYNMNKTVLMRIKDAVLRSHKRNGGNGHESIRP